MGLGASGCLRVVAADDSAVMRSVLEMMFELHARKPLCGVPPMELCTVVGDGLTLLEEAEQHGADVVLLDLEMPRLDGLGVLRRWRAEGWTVPVILCSAHTERGARVTLEALALGAKDYVMKPGQQLDFAAAMARLMDDLLPKIAALALARRRGQRGLPAVAEPSWHDGKAETLPLLANGLGLACPGAASAIADAGYSDKEPLRGSRLGSGGVAARVEVVVIAVSTGGPSALEQLLPALPRDFPVPVLIVQHMPRLFTGALAERLRKLSGVRVKEAESGERLCPGTAYLAPGDTLMEIAIAPRAYAGGQRAGEGKSDDPRPTLGELNRHAHADEEIDALVPVCGQVRLSPLTPERSCMLSGDGLFVSAARVFGAGALGVVMTGMGADGLRGARAIRNRGGTILAQDEASSAVWGMPVRVVQAGLAEAVLPLGSLGAALAERVRIGRSESLAPGTPDTAEGYYGCL